MEFFLHRSWRIIGQWAGSVFFPVLFHTISEFFFVQTRSNAQIIFSRFLFILRIQHWIIVFKPLVSNRISFSSFDPWLAKGLSVLVFWWPFLNYLVNNLFVLTIIFSVLCFNYFLFLSVWSVRFFYGSGSPDVTLFSHQDPISPIGLLISPLFYYATLLTKKKFSLNQIKSTGEFRKKICTLKTSYY